MTYQTVSATNATSAPRLRTFLPGSTRGLDEIRPESFRNATIEPVKVTAPMKTPMKTSAWWMAARDPCQAGVVEGAVPADEHRGEADEAVQQRDELGHAGHLDHAGTPQADRAADDHRDDEDA